jgi:hypothetical protein
MPLALPLALLIAPLALGQATPTAPAPTSAARPSESPPAAKAAVALGQRVRELQKKSSVLSTVVIVRDGASYCKAAEQWTPTQRFPVLIDDNSLQSQENIARFVRAFGPETVVRFASDTPSNNWNANRDLVHSALAASWSAAGSDPEALKAAWRAAAHAPPGVVVANENDPAWTAALALAAGRGQLLTWIGDDLAPRDLHKWWTAEGAAALDKHLQDIVSRAGLAWSDLGDTIDAITVCSALPNVFEITPKEARATMDRLGRLRPDAPNRWAWAGQVFGNPQEAAYRAMCALFLEADSAWLFDSYPKSAPWSLFSLTQSKAAFEQIQLKTTVFETPGATPALWRTEARKPLEAGLIFVNTKGNADFFELEGGLAYCGDLPWLLRPAAVHMVHSWSMQSPMSRDTLGGRWLERGAYLYYGSTNEPMLQGFTPCPRVAGLLALGASFAGACRNDVGPTWKLTVVGDPLATVAPGALATRAKDAPKLANLSPLATEAAAAVKAGDFAAALRGLILAGNSDSAARLAAALLKDRKSALTPAAARVAVAPLFRTGRNQDAIACFRLADVKTDDRSTDANMLRDMLWLSSSLSLQSRVSPPDQDVLNTLRDNLRPEQLDQDLIELSTTWSRAVDYSSALTMLESVAAKQTEPHLKKKAARAIEEFNKTRR